MDDELTNLLSEDLDKPAFTEVTTQKNIGGIIAADIEFNRIYLILL